MTWQMGIYRLGPDTIVAPSLEAARAWAMEEFDSDPGDDWSWVPRNTWIHDWDEPTEAVLADTYVMGTSQPYLIASTEY